MLIGYRLLYHKILRWKMTMQQMLGAGVMMILILITLQIQSLLLRVLQ